MRPDGLTFGILTSCSDDLDVQQSYPFTVETMPVPTRIVKGEPWKSAVN